MLRLTSGLFVMAVFLVGCSQPGSTVIQTRGATEEFHLRGECAKLSEQLEKDNPDSNPSAYESTTWSSNYSVKDNRCYVLESSSDNKLQRGIKTLFDGQTKESLAYLVDGSGYGGTHHNQAAGIYGSDAAYANCPSDPPERHEDCVYAAVTKYIDECMKRDAQ